MATSRRRCSRTSTARSAWETSRFGSGWRVVTARTAGSAPRPPSSCGSKGIPRDYAGRRRWFTGLERSPAMRLTLKLLLALTVAAVIILGTASILRLRRELELFATDSRRDDEF